MSLPECQFSYQTIKSFCKQTRINNGIHWKIVQINFPFSISSSFQLPHSFLQCLSLSRSLVTIFVSSLSFPKPSFWVFFPQTIFSRFIFYWSLCKKLLIWLLRTERFQNIFFALTFSSSFFSVFVWLNISHDTSVCDEIDLKRMRKRESSSNSS